MDDERNSTGGQAKREQSATCRSTAPASAEAHERVVQAFQLWEAAKPEDRVALLQKLLEQWEDDPV